MAISEILPRLVGGRIVHLDWAPVDSDSTEQALQLSVVTVEGEHIAVELRADLCDNEPTLSVFEKAEWLEGGSDA